MLATTQETAEALRVTHATVYRMIADGRIPQGSYTKIGNHWRFNIPAIEAHLLQQVQKPPRNP